MKETATMPMQDLSRYEKKTHVQIETRYLPPLCAGSFALVGLIFALGVLVGSRERPVADCPTTDPLAALDARSEESAKPKPGEVPLSYHETLTQPNPEVPSPASLPPAAPVALTETGGGGALRSPILEEPAVLEEVPAGEPGVFSLQVGSFPDQREASELARRLEQAGHRAFLVGVEMPERGGRWFRVRVGPFKDRAEAWRYQKLFEEKERIPAFVVKRRIQG